MLESDYRELGIEDDQVVLNMRDLTRDTLTRVYNLVRTDSEGEENIYAVERLGHFIDREC